jgi:hypothetical protein
MSDTEMTAANSKLHDSLCSLYVEWCAANSIPCDCSADEMLFIGRDLTSEQRKWLEAYCDLWDATFPQGE